MGQKNVSEFWEVVGGLQLVVVHDGESAVHGGGVGGGTDLGAIPGSGGAKEGSEPDVFLAVGRRSSSFGRVWFGSERVAQRMREINGRWSNLPRVLVRVSDHQGRVYLGTHQTRRSPAGGRRNALYSVRGGGRTSRKDRAGRRARL